METEQELIAKGWKKETLCIHLQEYDEKYEPHKFRRLTYEFGTNFTSGQTDIMRAWINEVNKRFPNIKMSVSGTGYYMPADEELDNNGNN